MFSPIKKIFTYIQKNATSNMFGGATAVNEVEKTDEDLIEIASTATAKANSNETMEEVLLINDNEDIELQITPSILINKSKNDSILEPSTSKQRQMQKTPLYSSDKGYGVIDLDDELADFADEPIEQITCTPTTFTVEEIEEDDYEDESPNDEANNTSANDFTIDLVDDFDNRDVIVLDESNSISSPVIEETNAEDPLAIDNYQSLDDEAYNPLTTPSLNNGEAENDIIWYDDNLDENDQEAVSSDVNEQCDSIKRPSEQNKAPKSSSDIVVVRSNEEGAEERDGGSDSGLGSENSTLQTTINSSSSTPIQTPIQQSKVKNTNVEEVDAVRRSSLESNQTAAATTSKSTEPKKPLRSSLKRRLVDVEVDVDESLEGSSSGSAAGQRLDATTQNKRPRRSINFDNVQIYYFPRQQGFSCVPTAGGCSLGMGARHIAFKTMTLAEHAAELRRAHRMQLQVQPRGSSSDETEESEEDYLSDGSGSDQDAESNGFLQPVTPKQRRNLLKAAGVRKIDPSEKSDCRIIRDSREVCGCSCREFCDPETCACSQSGIKCQVDRTMFPCGCTREACGNTVGRIEFSPNRVRTHFIHTIMRLDIERQQENPAGDTVGGNYYAMQTQSNYSSGYASPAYMADLPSNYYQQQQQLVGDSHEQLTPHPSTHTNGVSYGTLQDLHTAPYQLDSLDANLFASGSNATPSYGELLQPTYQNLNYAGSGPQISTYASYHQQPLTPSATSYLEQPATTNTTYSSCAVPSVPPYGSATTTAATAQYHATNALQSTTATMSNMSSPTSTFLSTKCKSAIATLSSSSTSAATAATTELSLGNNAAGNVNSDDPIDVDNYVSLNTPIASSSRFSQMKDLLQHNRNTTTALLAVSRSPSKMGCALNRMPSATVTTATNTAAAAAAASIETPPIEDAIQKQCLAFEQQQQAPTLISPAPIVGVVQDEALKTTAAATTIATTSSTATNATLPPQSQQQLEPLVVIEEDKT